MTLRINPYPGYIINNFDFIENAYRPLIRAFIMQAVSANFEFDLVDFGLIKIY